MERIECKICKKIFLRKSILKHIVRNPEQKHKLFYKEIELFIIEDYKNNFSTYKEIQEKTFLIFNTYINFIKIWKIVKENLDKKIIEERNKTIWKKRGNDSSHLLHTEEAKLKKMKNAKENDNYGMRNKFHTKKTKDLMKENRKGKKIIVKNPELWKERLSISCLGRKSGNHPDNIYEQLFFNLFKEKILISRYRIPYDVGNKAYQVDFYEFSIRTCYEIDSDKKDLTTKYQQNRTNFILSKGYKLVRYTHKQLEQLALDKMKWKMIWGEI